MHDLDRARVAPEHDLEAGEAGGPDLDLFDEHVAAKGERYQRGTWAGEEGERALDERTPAEGGDRELDRLLGRLIRLAGRTVGGTVDTPAGRALAEALERVAQAALAEGAGAREGGGAERAGAETGGRWVRRGRNIVLLDA